MTMNPLLSQTPYMIRALWQWCTDAGLSPQILVAVSDMTQVPRQFAVDGRIVLDISAEATNQLELGNEWITFQARFGSKVENLSIPVGSVLAIFAEETQQGMVFDGSKDADAMDDVAETLPMGVDALGVDSAEPAVKPAERSSPLKVVK